MTKKKKNKSHHKELQECAQYVKYTAFCRHGSLRAGHFVARDQLERMTLAYVDAHKSNTNVYEQLKMDGEKPLLIIASSATVNYI